MHLMRMNFIFKFSDGFRISKIPKGKFVRIFTSVLYSQPLQSYCRLSIGDFRGLWFRWSLPSGTPYYYARMTIDTDGQWRAIGNKIYCSRICCTLYKCVGKCCGKIVISYRLLRFIWVFRFSILRNIGRKMGSEIRTCWLIMGGKQKKKKKKLFFLYTFALGLFSLNLKKGDEKELLSKHHFLYVCVIVIVK